MNRRMTTKTLVTAALLAAMSIVLARLLVIWITPSVRISFGNLPIMLAGLMFGPIVGALVGAVADIIGAAFLSPFGWYPPLTLGPVLMGVIPALLRPLLRGGTGYFRVLAPVLTANVVSSMLVMTWVLSGYNGTPFLALITARVPLYLGITLVETLVITLLLKSPLMTAAGVRLIGGEEK